MAKEIDKVDFHLWVYPETIELIQKFYKSEGQKTKSMFIEDAIKFYCGYLDSECKDTYLPRVIQDVINSNMGAMTDRMCNILFKMCVEFGMMFHSFCALFKIQDTNRRKLRDGVVKELKEINGFVSFEKIQDYQNSLKK